MALSKIWVHAEAVDGKVATITLEMLAKARELGGTVECFYGGADAEAIAGTLGAHGATTVHATGDLSGGLAGVHVAAALASAVGDAAPDLIMLGTTQDGRDIGARLSVKLDKPVLTNNTEVELDGDAIVVSTQIFGGTQIVKTKFAAGGPPSPCSARSRSWPRRAVVALPPRPHHRRARHGCCRRRQDPRAPRRGDHRSQARRSRCRGLRRPWPR